MELLGKYTVFCEGARGHLTKRLKAQFNLEADCQPQIYGLGIKELWDIDPAKHVPGRVLHTQGWPLSESNTWGGAFLYHQANNQVALGLVTALDYTNPYVYPVRGIPALESSIRRLPSCSRVASASRTVRA